MFLVQIYSNKAYRTTHECKSFISAAFHLSRMVGKRRIRRPDGTVAVKR